jgi:hypothetical protein
MRTILVFISLLCALQEYCFTQEIWHSGVVVSKSTVFNVSYSKHNDALNVISVSDSSMLNLPLGISIEKRGAELFINSERELFSILNKAFKTEKAKQLQEVERRFFIHINIDDQGVPFQSHFYLNHDSKITPDELDYIHKGIMERIRFEIKREIPFGEPCFYRYTIVLKFSDLLNGEFPVLKKNEAMGKRKLYWEK